MNVVLQIAGIILNVFGTIFTLWTVLMQNVNEYGTAGEIDSRPDRFPAEKKRVKIGCAFIIIGATLQVFALTLV